MQLVATQHRCRAEDETSRSLRSFARSGLSTLDKLWREEDDEVGRKPELVVRAMRESGWRACDALDRERGAKGHQARR